MSPSKVQFEPTPNPATMKFTLGQRLVDEPTEFNHSRDTDRSPLAAKIFGFPWTSSVFLGQDFITVTKQDWVDWDVLAEPLAGLIQEHLSSGEPVLLELPTASDINADDPPLVVEIKNALNRDIRPVVALDGGDVIFHSLEGSILNLQMKGACAGCPSSSATLKEGIEVRLKELFPQLTEIRAI